MSAQIRILDDALVDQIAAGEVVERPASAARELLDNALDAGAGRISVEIEDGGRQALRVVDDGSGMSAEDALLAVRRHATSKIRTLADLERVRSLGFRGEALPSIASVSRFTLTPRRPEDVAGTRLRIEGGGEPEVRASGAPQGTTVELRDLFYNVPARRKFLKARQTETAHVHDVCLRAALARPDVALSLTSNQRRRLRLAPTTSLLERAHEALRLPNLSELRFERSGLAVEACLGPPEEARTGARQLYLFVNGRAVRDRRLAAAVAFAYGSVLPPGRYPKGALHLRLDPSEIDVNVHPQKTEVRFAGGKGVLDELTRGLARALGTVAWGRGRSGADSPRAPDFWQGRLAGALKAAPEVPAAAPTSGGTSAGAEAWGLAGEVRDGLERYSARHEARGANSETPGGSVETPSDAQEPRATELLAPASFFGSLRLLGQAQHLYLVCEGQDGLYLLDQHAADERVRYHGLRTAYEARAVTTQRLLFPERVELSAEEAALVSERGEELLGVGLEVSLLGPHTAAIHSVPSLVKRAPPERLLRDVLDELSLEGGRAFGDAIDTALATMACHGAIRGGDSLAPEEGRALLKALDAIPEFAGHCPHGRPVIHCLSWRELGRRLGR
ncbi:MAG: DNA mismatch repair endonuclease MutL [Deltaproteobacteria bacterium]|nr:DNA mismatch repair endonuclease MutL [Deltaproteobacteria bacterium]